jgi:uncharacterized repeat protein (TIGR03803 family)
MHGLIARSVLAIVVMVTAALGENARAATFTTIYTFQGGTDGIQAGGLTIGTDGALYGVTGDGGTAGFGTVFKLTPPAIAGEPWTKTILYDFTGGGDGGVPIAVTFDEAGALYGTTASPLYGSVFKLTPPIVPDGAWTFAVLHAFDNLARNPNSGVVVDGTGALYGAAFTDGSLGCGVIYKLSPPARIGGSWTERLLHTFNDCPPVGSVYPARPIFGPDGALYGTTWYGGNTGSGSLYRLRPPLAGIRRWSYQLLYSFVGGDTDGAAPNGSLVFDTFGAVYGTTIQGGAGDCGTAFKLARPQQLGGGWRETVIYADFETGTGCNPYFGLASTPTGALIGLTNFGGAAHGEGTLFQLQRTGAGWTKTTLHDFDVESDGGQFTGGIGVGQDGTIYGTSGLYCCGPDGGYAPIIVYQYVP